MKRYVIGQLSEIPQQVGKVVRLGSLEIALFRLSDGEIHALENRCPHKGGKLAEGIVSGPFVYCPLHDWKICVEDGWVQAPDRGCVRSFPVQIVGQQVIIELPEEAKHVS
ncbi:nitrite reductase small subunit NirD [Brevibacillus humidisoli]|uniref:nitrite reductase small subunit NirD n=1 Tax=Brevibacillus humidisoli TaxID=2895522 RepID=UPI001E644F00|nr:nitrite reductase small subunit NirD [Brevibacillus humidisoli]UFJ39617.1 nitrite reductase small subunit NirD [Brevibacillus humidisoli]